MEIIKEKNGESLKISLEGRLDTVTAPQLEEALNGGLDGITSLVFDFEKLDYISSAGLRILVSAQKIMNGKGSMEICNANEEIREVFDITGLSEIFKIS